MKIRARISARAEAMSACPTLAEGARPECGTAVSRFLPAKESKE